MRQLIDFINRVPTSAASRVRVAWMRLCGASIGHHCRLEKIRYRQPDQIQMGHHVAITQGAMLYPHLRSAETEPGRKIIIHDYVFLNAYVFLDAGSRIEIESGVMIGPYVYITDGDHGHDPAAGVRGQPMELSPVLISSGAWIGAHACILKGVTIGRNAVVGAGAVVTADVPPGAVVGGVPARPLRRAFGTHDAATRSVDAANP